MQNKVVPSNHDVLVEKDQHNNRSCKCCITKDRKIRKQQDELQRMKTVVAKLLGVIAEQQSQEIETTTTSQKKLNDTSSTATVKLTSPNKSTNKKKNPKSKTKQDDRESVGSTASTATVSSSSPSDTSISMYYRQPRLVQ